MTAPTTSPGQEDVSTPSPPAPEWIRLERTIEHIGKVKKESKRRIEWVLQRGRHDAIYRITLIWSVKTGKYSILCNQVEQVFDRRQGQSLIDDSFWLKQADGADVRIRIVAARSVPARTPFCQYDLMVNGCKFHDLAGEGFLPDHGLPSLVDVVVKSR